MIDFRYHIVSIVAVFLALALGLFLGSTSLQSTVTHNLKNQANSVLSENRRVHAANKQISSQNRALTNFTNAVEPYAVAGRLAGASVALVSAPGVDDSIRKSLATTFTEAGATVVADIGLDPAFLDASQDAELGQLARELAHGRPLPRQNGAMQASYLIARTLLARPGTLGATRARIASVLSTFAAGKMLSVAGAMPLRTAQYAVLLVPPGVPPTATPAPGTSGQDLILDNLAKQMRAVSSGTVVAGPTIQPGFSSGALGVARADATLTKSVSTVDAVDTAAGRIATVVALANEPAARVGSFGLATGGDVDDAPLLSPTPSP